MELYGTPAQAKEYIRIMTARGTSSVEFGIIPVNVLPFFEERLQEIVETHATGILNIMTFAELLHWLKEDKLELWVGMYNKQVEVAVITQVVKHSVYSSLSILWLGGKNMLRYRRLGLQKLEYFAAAHKLQNLSFSGPEFWAI